MSAIIRTHGLSVHYGGELAIDGIDLEILRGRISAIVGPSGCGKTTFLSTINRLTDLIPDCRVEGSVRVANEEVHGPACDVMALRRRVGMVFQKPNPFPLSIRKNLALPLREHHVPRRDLDAIIEQSLTDVGLWNEVKNRLDAPAETLSGGQQQRLCIARTLALDPEVILFDEPCSALDPMSSDVVEELIVSLRDRVTIVIVTHNLAQARRIADSIAVFWRGERGGVLIEHGPTKSLFENATSAIAKSYLAGSRG